MKRPEEKNKEECAGESADFIGEERGQISVLMLLGIIPLIFLIALIFNTATQTSRKIQMQGAADAGVLSASVWQARGMNLIVLNNNSMAEILSLMIVVRSLERTAFLMPQVTAPLLGTPFAPVAVDADVGSIAFYPAIFSLDQTLNGRDALGWQALRILDNFNQIIRRILPPIVLFENHNYATKNGASFALLTNGETFSPPNLTELNTAKEKILSIGSSIASFGASFVWPRLPVSRKSPKFLAIRADECQLKLLAPIRWIGRIVLPIYYHLSIPIAIILYEFFIEINLLELKAGDNRNAFDIVVNKIRKAVREAIGLLGNIPIVGDILRKALNAAVSAAIRLLKKYLRPLQWSNSSHPPMPMLLSETPGLTSTQKEEDVDLKKVRKYLQLLSLTIAERKEKSPIGGLRFPNKSALFLPEMQLTYAQAEVYNPTKWSMFSQDWRAKLAKATVLDTKFTDWSFANNH